MDSVVDDIKERLEDIVKTEREGIDRRLEQAEQQAIAAPIGETIAWSNPDSGNSGTVTPVRDGTERESGAYCREFQQTVTVGGRSEEAYGQACRKEDGTWEIVGG